MLTQNLFSCNPSNEATKKFPYFKTGEKFFRPLSNICANSLFQTGDTYAETGENCTKDFPDFPRIYQEDHWHNVSIQTLKTQPGQCFCLLRTYDACHIFKQCGVSYHQWVIYFGSKVTIPSLISLGESF